MMKYFASLFILLCAIALVNCGKQKPDAVQTEFTKADSLMDCYLAYQDSILQSWNVMINDDNQKINSMHNLLHELFMTAAYDRDLLRTYEGQLDHLAGLRYTQLTMGNVDVVEEYDFASEALVAELLSLAESKAEFASNPTIQNLVEVIRMADQRVYNYREEYDSIVLKYNNFLRMNRTHLQEISQSDSMLEKHLFQMVSPD
ncbi:MAG: hypothetical protein OEV74_14045 [Cyclobacteriaceae bacterium]|jgi:hypothetical protein|nr:hypothetical protein [Cyclobacteriaceae bacterium]MDH4297404.1 hypothetical protein [Cyclobacteriaceae bacterium]MDH5251161.1 hypothetical protein [Cyclobacteriaceae bacterium]